MEARGDVNENNFCAAQGGTPGCTDWGELKERNHRKQAQRTLSRTPSLKRRRLQVVPEGDLGLREDSVFHDESL